MNSPSPLLPQGAIPPKNTSNPARVLLIATMVVICHVVGLGVILMQGCQKDTTKTAGGDTNTPALTLPPLDTATNAYYTSASNLPPAVTADAASNTAAALPAFPTVTPSAAPTLQEPPVTAAAHAETPAGAETEYKIARGDTLSGIARKHKVTIGALQLANPGIDPRRLMPGQAIKVPAPAPAPAAPTASAAPSGSTSAAAPTAVAGTYKIKPGDTLIKIARAHGVTVNQLRSANNMRTTQIQAGRVLKIPAKTQNTAAAPTNGAPQ